MSAAQKWSQELLDEEKALTEMLDDSEGFPLGKVPDDAAHLEPFVDMARDFVFARRTVTFKPQESVLRKFKERAEKEGIPYHALLNSVMKKYAE